MSFGTSAEGRRESGNGCIFFRFWNTWVNLHLYFFIGILMVGVFFWIH